MSAKKNKKRKTIFITLLVFLLPVFAYLAYDWWEAGSFKRAYEHGTTVEQLSTLMTTTRYVQDIRNGGYLVDQYDIVENGEVTNLETNGDPKLTVRSPGTSKELEVDFNIVFKEKELNVYFYFNNEMELKNYNFYRQKSSGMSGEKIEVDKATEEKLVKYVQEEVKKIPRDIYEAKYGKKK